MKEKIKGFLKGKEQATLKEIYGIGGNKDSIRSYVNLMTKNGELTRISKGTYKLTIKQ